MINKFQYFTFTQRSPFRNYYVKLPEEYPGGARELMHKLFGSCWGFQYSWKEFEHQIEQYNLKQLNIGLNILGQYTFFE